ncbi:MAG: hypothetical protein Q9178_004350 [Gyalolechia marmorata]
MSCSTASTTSHPADNIGSSNAESSIGSDITLAHLDAAPVQPDGLSPLSQHPPPTAPDPPTSLSEIIEASVQYDVDTASIGLDLSRARSYLHAAFKSNWQQLQHKRLTLCKGAYLFVINVTILVVALITLLTSNQPTHVDKKSLEAVTQSLEMHKTLLQQSVQDAKTANETLKSTMESLDAEKESLELQRQSFEKEQSAFDLQKQSLELAKWTAYHKEQVTSDRCAEALKAFDQPPPHLPSNATIKLSKRRPHGVSKYHQLTAVKIQDGPTSFNTYLAATTLITSLPFLNLSAAPTDMRSERRSSTVLYATTAVFLGVLLLIVLFAWRVARMRQRAAMTRKRIWLDAHKQQVVNFSWQEKGERSSDNLEALPILIHNSSAASGSAVSLPVGLRNRKDANRQITAERDIWHAAFHGNTIAIHELLDDCHINELHPHFGTPLQAAAQGGHFEVVKILLKLRADPNAYGGYFHSPLQAAAYLGDLELAKLLLAHGADENAVGGSCGNPFLAAVKRGSIEMVRCLINAGADVHQSGATYGNALQIASFGGFETIVSLLLEHGVAVNARGGCYDTALIASAMKGHIRIVTLLLQHGADINWTSESYGSAVQIACRQDYIEIARVLVEHGGCDTSIQDQDRRTPLHEAARSGWVQLVKSLLQREAEVSLPDRWGCTPLHDAAVNGYDEIVELLLASGADILACDEDGAQPLFRACYLGKEFERTVTLLLDANADINARDAHGRTAIHCPSRVGNVRVQQILIDRGALINAVNDEGQTPLHRATVDGNLPNVKLLLEAGAEVNLQDHDQVTALHIAITQGFDEIALLLLDQANIDINARSASVFQEAIARGNRPVVEMMMAKGAALNTEGGRYGSVVQAAVYSGDLAMSEMLLKRMANVNLQGGEYGPALNLAAVLGHFEMVRLLLEYGANPYILGGTFGCVLSSARKSQGSSKEQKEEMIKLLVSYGAKEPSNERLLHVHDRWILTSGG